MKKPAVQGGLSMDNSQPIVGTAHFQNTNTDAASGLEPSSRLDHEPAKEGSELAAWQRLVLMQVLPPDSLYSPSKAKDSTYSKLLKAELAKTKHKAKRGKRTLGHTKAMACFDRCVEIQAKRERNSLRRRARLLKTARDLGLAAYINRQEIAQRVLEAKARCGGEGFKPLTAADRAAMPKPVVHWLVRGLIPANDMTIIGGRPKVGCLATIR